MKKIIESFIFRFILTVAIFSLYISGFISRAQSSGNIIPLNDEKIYLQIDKPLYELGDDIWFKVYLRDGNTLKPSPKSEIVYTELVGPAGKINTKLKLLYRNGKCSGDFKLDVDGPGGIYKIRAYTKWMKNFGEDACFEKEITVQKVLLPRLLSNLEFEKKSYGGGEHVIAFLKLESTQKKALVNFPVNWKVSLNGKEFTKGSIKTNSEGKANIEFDLPEKLNSEDGLLNVMIDYEGFTESISRAVPIVLENISLHFFPEGGDLIQNIEGRVAFKAMNQYGKAADVEGEITDDKGFLITNFKSYHNGMGFFNLNCQENKKYFAKFTKPGSVKTVFELPSPHKNGFALKVNSQTKENIKISLYNPENEKGSVIVRLRDQIVYSAATPAKKGFSEITIPLSNFPIGIAQITLFDQFKNPQCERLIFINRHKQLNVKVVSSKEKYLPREEVELTVKVTDEHNQPVDAELSVAVVDDKVISFADDKQDNILSHFLMSSELQGKIQDPSFYFKTNEARADSALDLVMMTHGWRRYSWKKISDGSAEKIAMAFQYLPEKTIIKGIAALNSPDNRAANAKVKIRYSQDSVYTDKYGHFEIKNPNPFFSEYLLEVKSKEGYKRYVTLNDFTGDYIVEKEAAGKITDKITGKKIKGVHIFYKGTIIDTYSDSLGVFSFSIAPENKPVLIAVHKDYEIAIYPSPEKIINIAMNPLVNPASVVFEKTNGSAECKYTELTNKDNVLEFNERMMDAMVKEYAQSACMKANMRYSDYIYSSDYFNTDKITYVDEYPKFPGGTKALQEFVYKSIRYPESAIGNKEEGEITVGFWVKSNGKIDKVKVQSGGNWQYNNEAIRIVKQLPDWIPAKKGSETVDYPASVTVKFSFINNNSGQPFKVYILENKQDSDKIEFSRTRDFYWPVYNEEKHAYQRNDFRKTIYWNPSVRTGKDGMAICKFYNSDEITRFRTTIEGLDGSGNIGRNESTYITQLPFSIDARIPPFLTFGDKPKIPVTITNNTSKKISVDLSLKLPPSITSSQNGKDDIVIPANSKKLVEYELNVGRVETKGDFIISASSSSDYLTDNFKQRVEIFPSGFPASKSFCGDSLFNTSMVSINDPVQGSIRANFTAFPGILSQLMEGVESILHEPHGCFEQTSSTTYPNILALQLMKETGTIDGEVNKKALGFIETGYKRLVSFETSDKGYEWFGHAPYHPALTAYGLLEFTDMQKVYASVDNKMMVRTKNRILADADVDGFKRIGNRTQFGQAQNNNVWNSYICYALSESGVNGIDSQLSSAFKKAMDGNDIYIKSLVANAMFKSNKIDEANRLMSGIKTGVKEKGFGNLNAKESITGSGGVSLQVETASFILLALLNEKEKNEGMILQGINFLLNCRRTGGFGSTQSTVMALKALTAYSKNTKKPKTDGEVEVLVDGWGVGEQKYIANSPTMVRINGFDQELDSGLHKIEVKFRNTKNPIPFEFNVKWFTNTPESSPGCKVELSTNLINSQINQGETARLNISTKNKTSEVLPNTMVQIGIPGGLSVQPWQLKELSDKKVFDYYEIKDNYIYFYYTGMSPAEEKIISLDLKAEMKGEYQGPASNAYLYYTNEFKNWNSGIKVSIK